MATELIEAGDDPRTDIDFDSLEPIRIKVSYRGKRYWLTEASEDAATKYRDRSIKAAKMYDGKVVGMEGGAEVEPFLVSLCLYEADPKDGSLRLTSLGDPNPEFLVPMSVVKSWPSRVVKPLYNRVREASDLTETDTVETVQKAIGKLQRKLRALLDERDRDPAAEDDPSKNEPGATQDTSA